MFICLSELRDCIVAQGVIGKSEQHIEWRANGVSTIC